MTFSMKTRSSPKRRVPLRRCVRGRCPPRHPGSPILARRMNNATRETSAGLHHHPIADVVGPFERSSLVLVALERIGRSHLRMTPASLAMRSALLILSRQRFHGVHRRADRSHRRAQALRRSSRVRTGSHSPAMHRARDRNRWAGSGDLVRLPVACPTTISPPTALPRAHCERARMDAHRHRDRRDRHGPRSHGVIDDHAAGDFTAAWR